MRLAWQYSSVAALAVAAVSACDTPIEVRDDLTPGGTTALVITPAKSVWTWDEVTSTGVRATLRNSTIRTLESALGDKFNAAMEQADLFVVKGSSGALEREEPDGWRIVVLNTLVEGIKRVTLRPGASYSLTALLREPRRTGMYRIRVDFYEAPGGTKVFSDYSEPFEIR
ncbi:MAG TPA: hypothetical protein VGQ52_09705 [Gemmatimonadaceae bacterium]|jgi:hypothetical protein|nr:hypothetical protein [Gemmatimonadaceae bacterium]